MSPQATSEHGGRWPGWDGEAMEVLEKAGYKITREWSWIKPQNYIPTERELDAINYLVHEWDFNGLED